MKPSHEGYNLLPLLTLNMLLNFPTILDPERPDIN